MNLQILPKLRVNQSVNHWHSNNPKKKENTVHISVSEGHGTERLLAHFRELTYVACHAFCFVSASRAHTETSEGSKVRDNTKTSGTNAAVSCPQHRVPHSKTNAALLSVPYVCGSDYTEHDTGSTCSTQRIKCIKKKLLVKEL